MKKTKTLMAAAGLSLMMFGLEAAETRVSCPKGSDFTFTSTVVGSYSWTQWTGKVPGSSELIKVKSSKKPEFTFSSAAVNTLEGKSVFVCYYIWKNPTDNSTVTRSVSLSLPEKASCELMKSTDSTVICK